LKLTIKNDKIKNLKKVVNVVDNITRPTDTSNAYFRFGLFAVTVAMTIYAFIELTFFEVKRRIENKKIE